MSRAIGWACLVAVGVTIGAYYVVAPADPMRTDVDRSFEPPSSDHPLGTDAVGRDVWARLAAGAWSSLLIALVAVSLSTTIGVVVGGFAGLASRRFARPLDVLTDTLLAFPRFVLLINLAAVVPLRSPAALGVLIGVSSWMRTARLVRTEVLSIRERGFVEAARAAGAHSGQVMAHHIVPQVLGLVLETARIRVASVILTAASLDYLGIGLPPDSPTWGRLIGDGQAHLLEAPWVALPAVCVLCLTAVGLVLAGERAPAGPLHPGGVTLKERIRM